MSSISITAAVNAVAEALGLGVVDSEAGVLTGGYELRREGSGRKFVLSDESGRWTDLRITTHGLVNPRPALALVGGC